MDIIAKWQVANIMSKLLESAVMLRDDPNHSREEAVEDLLVILDEIEEIYESLRR